MEIAARSRSLQEDSSGEDDLSILVDPVRTRPIVVVGAGGHGRELADIVRAASASTKVGLLGIVDDGEPDRFLLAASGIRFLGASDSVLDRDVDVYIGVGDPATRERLDEQLHERVGAPMFHPSAVVGSRCELDDGVVLAQGAIVTTNVVLGRHTHLNVAASVSHDCRVGPFTTICPGVRLTGAVTVGSRVFVGTGAVILPGVTVGDDVIIGAGAVVRHDVPSGLTVSGVPAHPH